MRIGIGYDVHRLVPDRPLILGGVEIPSEKGLAGHSDADVLSHAIVDAILGAANLGDIGTHFPDTDPRWCNVSSLLFLQETESLVAPHFRILNIDSVLIAQKPKVVPYIPQMVTRIAAALKIDRSAVSIKATTTEGLGFTGREQGIAAHAVACLAPKENKRIKKGSS